MIVTLEGKVHPPAPRSEWIPRPRLIDTLVEATDKKVILVEAPVGYGKTILLAEWLRDPAEPRPCAWVTLDATDNDPARLWAYIGEALGSIDRRLQERTATIIYENPGSIIDVVVPWLVNEISVLSQKLILVLDDFHEIKDQVCRDSVDLFIENLPNTVQLVISTRTHPPLRFGPPTSSTLTIRAAQLRFQHEEAAELLNVASGHSLSGADIDRLVDRTEGWPAGLYLATLSLKDRTDPERFVDAFAGDNRLVVDYLTMEILNKQPGALRRFLIRTSILNKFTSSLSDVVVGTHGSGEILTSLEQSNLFLVPIPKRRGWYRYHRLFKDLLRSELERSEPDLVPELHRRAAEWHHKRGFVGEAMEHAIAARDIPMFRELVGTNWCPYWRAGHIEDVYSWLTEFGAKRIASDGALSAVAAWTCALSGRIDELDHWLKCAERGSYDGPLPDGAASLQAEVALVRAIFPSGGLAAALDAARRSVELERGADPHRRAKALCCLGYYQYLSGDLLGATTTLEEVTDPRTADRETATFATAQLSMIAGDRGSYSEMRKLARASGRFIQGPRMGNETAAPSAYLALGLAAHETGDAGAVAELELALDLSRRSSWLQPWSLLQALLALTRVHGMEGDKEAEMACFEEAQTILEKTPDAGILGDRFTELGSSLAADPSVSKGSLTKRELAVLQLLPSSFTQREIGEQLYLSINTVKSHTRSIFRKLAVESRDQAVAKAKQLGLL